MAVVCHGPRAAWRLLSRLQVSQASCRGVVARFGRRPRHNSRSLLTGLLRPLLKNAQEFLDNADLGNGHVWKKRTVAASTAAINLAVSCERCNLYIEQINTPAIFDRKIAHPCIGIPAALPTEWVLHSSHTLQNKGSFWICESCSGMVIVAAAKTSLVLRNPCKGLSSKGGKVPKSAYQLETPKSFASKAKVFGVPASTSVRQDSAGSVDQTQATASCPKPKVVPKAQP